MTARDIITGALKKIGALASGETLSASEASDGLAELNRMLGSWRTEGSLVQISEIADLSDELSLPDGYADALVYNLAVRLAPDYGRMVPDMVVMAAIESMATIKRTGHRPSYLKVDDGLLPHGQTYNILTGEYE
jgi:hypothetical protein